ncbi:MAG: ABC transporter substrate-binding protein [Candidatus Tectomicrobia bacterium]|uniref:ABC transporter substrate-binding protein n=1 Tax=Tectimicrobiota bacterium TaxID=2528274 RepID=A0A938B229_UNCTE|nr:ABC transporter substrate-binding protein [Candidatus Tectomicrobia bacterium]
MQWKGHTQGWWLGLLGSLVLACSMAQAQSKPKLDRLVVAIAPLGWDTNFTWLQSRSGQLDKRPALEYLVGIDRNTGTYIPELAEKWEMNADGKSWTFWLRKGVKFHETWGEFTAKDVRHAIFLITQTESVQTDAGFWRSAIGIGKNDSAEEAVKKIAAAVELVNDHQVVFRLKYAVPELLENLSANADLVMESKARWDAGGKELYGQKVVGTGPFEFVERKVGSYVLYKRVENHWRKTPEYKELEFRWVPEGVTRLATLLAEEVHISDVDRALQKDAVAKGMKIVTSKKHAMQHQWYFGGMYFATPEKLDKKVPFVDTRVRQAMNKAINRNALGQALFGGKGMPLRIPGYHPELDEAIWPGIWNPDWDKRFEDLYGYDPKKAKALLAEAGYKDGFEFTVYLYTLPGLPEQVDIGQALALDWEAIGLKPKLTEIDFPRVREQYRTKTIHGALWPGRNAIRALETARIINKAKDSVVYAYEHPYIEERHESLNKVVDKAERARLLQEIGNHEFTEFASIPLFFLYADAAVNPKYVAEYTFPGVITGFFTHLEYVKLVQ